jgi:hypothetical protein
MQKTNLLDLMTPKEQEKMKAAFRKRMAGDGTYKKDKIPPLIYLLAEAGVYFGWQAIVDAKRGYTEAKDDEGNLVKIPLTMEEFNGLVMAGRKFRYSDYINQARVTRAGVSSSLCDSKSKAKQAFESGVESFRKVIDS